MEIPLDHAHDEAMPLVECALMPKGHGRSFDAYAAAMASTIHLDSVCFEAASPLVRPPNETKSCSARLNGAVRVMYNLRALTGHRRLESDSLSDAGRADREITCALTRVPIAYGTYPCLGLRTTKESLGPNSRQDALVDSA